MKDIKFYRIRNQLARLGIPRSEIDIIMQTSAAKMIPYGKTLVAFSPKWTAANTKQAEARLDRK